MKRKISLIGKASALNTDGDILAGSSPASSATQTLVFGQRCGKTQKSLEHSYRMLMENTDMQLIVTSQLIYDEMLRLFPQLSGRIILRVRQ